MPSPLLYNLATGSRVHLSPSTPSGRTLLAVWESSSPSSPGDSLNRPAGRSAAAAAAAARERVTSSAPLRENSRRLERGGVFDRTGGGASLRSSLPPPPPPPPPPLRKKGSFYRRSCSVGDTPCPEKATATPAPSEAAVATGLRLSKETQQGCSGAAGGGTGTVRARGSSVVEGLAERRREQERRRERESARVAECRLACRALSCAAKKVLRVAFWKWRSRAATLTLQLDREEQRSRASRQVCGLIVATIKGACIREYTVEYPGIKPGCFVFARVDAQVPSECIYR